MTGRSNWLTRLHRLGYFTTALVALGLIWIAVLITSARFRQSAWQIRKIAETRYSPGLLRGPDYLKPYMSRLPTLQQLGPDALRFIAYPEMEGRIYLLVLRRRPGRSAADGLLVIRVEPYQKLAATERFAFQLPFGDYRKLMDAIDHRLDGAPGSDQIGTDGTDIAFERRRGNRITSGAGNMIEPYRTAGEDVLAVLHDALPKAPLPPAHHDWYDE